VSGAPRDATPMSARPRVSAVVVSFESATPLRQLLPALRAAVDEVVVVDNASRDGSAELAEELVADAVVVRHGENRGCAAGVNAGVAASSGDLVLLCNPDVELDAEAVTALVAAALRHPGDVVGPRVHYPDGRLQLSRSGPPTLRNLLGEQVLVPETTRPGSWPARLWPRWGTYDVEVPGPVLSGCSLLIPRTTLQSVGPFDEGYFMYWEEVDWQLRAIASGHTCWLVPSAQVCHARGSSSGPADPRQAAALHRSTRRFLRRWLPQPRRALAILLLGLGQGARLLLWSVPPLRGRARAEDRRVQHAVAWRALWSRTAPARPHDGSVESAG
jgi:N-acetylglucosaminyl-diphospho-decaprenol L-rhamnosyltransferase